MSEHAVAQMFKALGDENRIRILKLLGRGEKCACNLLETLEISQPTLSHHMHILCDAGLVSARKEGKWMHYTINCEGSCRARNMLVEVLSPENKPANCTCSEK